MMREAEEHVDEDKKNKAEIEARNLADQAVYGAERLLKDSGDKVSAADREAIEAGMAGVKKALESNDGAAITQALEQLTSAQHKAAEAMYKQDSEAPSPTDQAPEGGSATEGEVIDAEVVEEK